MKTQQYLLLSICLFMPIYLSAQWIQQGPGPSENGQVEGITESSISGAVSCITPHPTNANILYVGSVNGGVWRTQNALDTNPFWENISSAFEHQAIGALELDPTDPSFQTLVAANGRTSSFGSSVNDYAIYRTTTGTSPWTNIDPTATFSNSSVYGIAANGATIVVASDMGVWITTNTGNVWSRTSTTSGELLSGVSYDLIQDPNNSDILYTHSGTGIYKSPDAGSSWDKVSDATVDGFLTETNNVKMCIGQASNVFVAICQDSLRALYKYDDLTQNWTSLDLPFTIESGNHFGIHINPSGDKHLSLVADPNNDDVVYIGGDRQPAADEPGRTLPNSLGADNFTGRLFRVDASQSPGSQFSPITHNGTANNSAPHADSRDMDFDANGNLLEGDDGGIYKQSSPTDNTGDWFSLNGNLNIAEVYNVDWDALSNIAITGLQDNGVQHQLLPTDQNWKVITVGDGGDVAVDDMTSPVSSYRFSSTQEFGSPKVSSFLLNNNFLEDIEPGLVNEDTGEPITANPSNPITFPFITPLKINNQDGNRILLVTNEVIFESEDQLATLDSLDGITFGSLLGSDVIEFGAADNHDIIYYTTQNNVYIRTTDDQPFDLAPFFTLDFIMGLTMDPDDSQSAFVITENNVYETTNGNNFNPISGDLLSLDPGTLRSVAYVSNSTEDILAVGSDKGVYVAEGPDFDDWELLGTGLPNVQVYDLIYDRQDEILVAATLGRGVWSYSFSEREPIDVALVMDMSGSMLQDACPGCESKVDVLKNAVEIFIQLWRGLAVGNDRLGSIYFRTNVDDFSIDSDVMLPMINNANSIINDIQSQVVNQLDRTAMGGGVQHAINELSDDSWPRNIILFTDGIQNVDPGIRLSDLSIVNGQYDFDSNISPTNPITVLNQDLGIKINTIGVGATSDFETQLASIAQATEGETRITFFPEQDLIQFYIEELVEALRNHSPQLVAYVKSEYNNQSNDVFSVNPYSERVIFKVSYKRNQVPDVVIKKGGVDVTSEADYVEGDFYQIFSFSFTDLQRYLYAPYIGDWEVQLTGGNSNRKYQIGVLADEEVIDYETGAGDITLSAGDPIDLSTRIRIGDAPWVKKTFVEAVICQPRFSFTNVITEANPKNLVKFEFEKGSPLSERKFAALYQDKEFREMLKPQKAKLKLKATEKGIFKAVFKDTKIAGKYNVKFKIKGYHEKTGEFERIETKTVVVHMGKLDEKKSNIKSQKMDGNKWVFSIRPIDVYGNMLGSNFQNRFQTRVENGNITNIKDNGDGSYDFYIKGNGEKNPVLSLGLFGQTWFKGRLKK